MLRDRLKRLEQRAQEFMSKVFACEHCRDGDYGALLIIDAPNNSFEPRDDNPIYDLQGRCRKCGTESQNRIIMHFVGPRRSQEPMPC